MAGVDRSLIFISTRSALALQEKYADVQRCSSYPRVLSRMKFIFNNYILLSFLSEFQVVKIDIILMKIYTCIAFWREWLVLQFVKIHVSKATSLEM